MAALRFPTTSEVLALNERVLGHPGGLTDEGKLSGGLLRAQQVAHYEGGDEATIAAYLIAGATLAHAFTDGNKRTAFATLLWRSLSVPCHDPHRATTG